MHSRFSNIPGKAIGLTEFIGLTALLMALTALAIDVMLPALPAISDTFGLADPNDRQLMVTAYLAGFALGQPFHGPLSDRFGRKPLLALGLILFIIGALWAMWADSYDQMLAARVLQGLGAAAPRVVSIAVVRDQFAGRDMARVMSFVMTIFIIVPVIAPTLGAGIASVGDWHWIFAVLLVAGLVALLWMGLRLPETRPAGTRTRLTPSDLLTSIRTVVTTRRTLGYTIASGFLFGCLMSYIGSAQQVFVDVYGLTDMFPIIFSGIAVSVALASIVNARIVGRLGMRRVSHMALLGFVGAGLLLSAFGFPEHPPLFILAAFLAWCFFCFGLIAPNFNALAMEPLGRVAGMASSFIGFYTTGSAAVFGWVVGQAFDGTVRPLTGGFVALGVATLATVLVTERFRLMQAAE